MKKGFGVIFEFEVLKTLWWYDYDIWMSWHTVWHKYIWQGKILMNQSCIVKTFPINTLHLEYKNLSTFAYNLLRTCVPIEWPCLGLISHNQTAVCIELLCKQPDHECFSLFPFFFSICSPFIVVLFLKLYIIIIIIINIIIIIIIIIITLSH